MHLIEIGEEALMTAQAQITMSHPETGKIIYELKLNHRYIEVAKKIAKVPNTDPLILGSYPLSRHNAVELCQSSGWQVPDGDFLFCLDAYEDNRKVPALTGQKSTTRDIIKDLEDALSSMLHDDNSEPNSTSRARHIQRVAAVTSAYHKLVEYHLIETGDA